MSLDGHIGQVLALKDQLIPISSDTVFHYDGNHDYMAFNQGVKVPPCGYKSSLFFNENTTIQLKNPLTQNNLLQDWTVETWAKLDIAGPATQSLLNFNIGIYLAFSSNTRLLNYINSGASDYHTYGHRNMKDGLWHHIAITFKNSIGETHIYVDGIRVSGGIINTKSNPTGLPDHLIIGSGVKGSLSELRIWDHYRSIEQIKELMDKELSGEESGLAAYWKLNEGEGIIASDSSKYMNEGIITNGTWAEGRANTVLIEKGRFGRAIQLEEETTNMLLNPTFTGQSTIANTFGSYGATYEIVNTSYIPNTKSQRLYATNADNGSGELNKGISITMPLVSGTTYTISFYGNASWERKSRLSWYCQHIKDGVQEKQDVGNGWYRYSWKIIAKNTLTHIIYIRPNGNSIWSFDCLINAPQIEMKPYATSFTPETRAQSTLRYDPRLFPSASYTFNCWVKLDRFNATVNQPIFTLEKSATDRLVLGYQAATGKLNLTESGASLMLSEVSPDLNEWHMVTLVFDGTISRLYLNANEIANSNRSTYYATDQHLFKIGESIDGVLNGSIDEVRVEKISITPDVITSWYHGGPSYNYLDYTGFSY